MPPDMAEAFDPARVAPLVGWLCSEACDVSGEVLVSGAGAVRRASTGETARWRWTMATGRHRMPLAGRAGAQLRQRQRILRPAAARARCGCFQETPP